MIFKVGVSKNVHGLASVPIGAQETFTSHRILAHPQGFVGQVAWSPSGHLLLTKLGRGVKIWTEVCCSARRLMRPCAYTGQDGVCKRTIDRRRNVQSITWMPGGEGPFFVPYTYTDFCTDAHKIHQRSYLLRAAM